MLCIEENHTLGMEIIAVYLEVMYYNAFVMRCLNDPHDSHVTDLYHIYLRME